MNTSQEHFKEELCKFADVDLHGIKCMSLRLASKDAKEIFNANQLPSLDSRDDIVQKLIREYHQVSINFCRITHFNKKNHDAKFDKRRSRNCLEKESFACEAVHCKVRNMQ